MAFTPHDRQVESIVPKDVQEVFEETDIEKTWDYLEKTFKLNKNKWKKEFEKIYNTSSRQYTKMELFIRFGKDHFQEPLNKILFRKDFHPTWINLIRFMVAGKLRRAEEERDRVAKMYGRNPAYKIHNRKY